MQVKAAKRKRGSACNLCEVEKPQPGTDYCESCQAFAKLKFASAEQLAEAMTSSSKKSKKIFAEIEQHASGSYENKTGEHITYQVISESKLSETYGFMSKVEFEDTHGCKPDKAKVKTTKALNSKQETVHGVLIGDNVAPRLEISCSRRWVKTGASLPVAEVRYPAHVDEHFVHQCAQSGRFMGQNPGTKYKPKLKGATVYTKQQLQDLVAKFQKRKSAETVPRSVLDAMCAGHDNGCDAEGEDSGSGSEGDDEDCVSFGLVVLVVVV